MRQLKLPYEWYSQSLRKIANKYLGQATGVQITTRKYYPINHEAKESIKNQFNKKKQKNLIELEYGVYDPENGEFFLTHDTGIFSCLSVTLWSICDLLDAGYQPRKINFLKSLSAYQDANEKIDPYSELFLESSSHNNLLRDQPYYRFDHHAPYSTQNLHELSALIARYFNPSTQVDEKIRMFRSQYLAPNQRYVGVCIRGTDKSIEVPHTDSSLYIEKTASLLEQGLVDRVLIQTDQAQIYDIFRHRFNELCDAFEDLPRTDGMIVIHKTSAIEGQRIGFAKDLIAAINLISEMPYIITHTGNIGAWIALKRGNLSNFWQATPSGITSQAPD